MKNKKIFVLFCIWAIFIWTNSLIPASGSSQISGGISEKLYQFLHLPITFDQFHFLIRKAAHFSEYALLGILSMLSLKKEKWAVLVCIVIACFDETIQLFVAGRSGQISDVLLDSLGSCCGIICMKLLLTFKMKND